MTHPSLLAAIIAEPDDDLPRLIYADWLDDHGEGELAEFIRTSIECGRDMPAVNWFEVAYGGEQKHISNISHLLADHASWKIRCAKMRIAAHLIMTNDNRKAWSGPAADFVPQFRKGFVERITLSWTDWLTHADQIRAACPVTEVRLTTDPVFRIVDDRYARQRVVIFRDFQTVCAINDIELHKEPPRHRDLGDEACSVALSRRWPGISFTLPERRQPVITYQQWQLPTDVTVVRHYEAAECYVP